MNITVNLASVGQLEIPAGTTLSVLAKRHPEACEHRILMAKLNNELRELRFSLTVDWDSCAVEFLDITDPGAFRAYQSSMAFLMIYAVKQILGKKTRVIIQHSINKNFLCKLPEFQDERGRTDEGVIARIESRMAEAIGKNFPIERCSMPVETCQRLALEFGMEDKAELLRYRRTSNASFYRLDGYYDYFYGQMLMDTGDLTAFKLRNTENGFLLCFPNAGREDPYRVDEPETFTKVSQVFEESARWGIILKVDTVAALNAHICNGTINNIIHISEALHDKKLAQIAEDICRQRKRLVLISGPSSSGKTTFAHRLFIALSVNGARPKVVSLDNYYMNRDDVPLDEFGQPDLETIDSIDLPQINADLTGLLSGETVEIPRFNFLTAKREPHGVPLKLEEDGILIMEGIHGLNERLTASISKDLKFKIFISALTQLNIDDHNRVPTTDSRLIRRIVRDSQFRGAPAAKTIKMWPSVLRGERVYIFPFQEEADATFNSALAYEMCVLKQFVEPLLFKITRDMPEYAQARRLIKFLDAFLGVSSELVLPNSLLREFIGGSCFAI